MQTLNDIDIKTKEGRALLAALGILTVSPELHILKEVVNGRQTEPDAMLQKVVEAAAEIYPEETQRGEKETTLLQKIESAINSVSRENESNTPDFILAKYLIASLKAFEAASLAREKWYGKSLQI